MSLQNEAQQAVQFAVTFVVSAGDGGFVCDDELQNYLNAGYSDAAAPGQTTIQIGCDEVQLLSGTRLLTLDFGINQNQRLEPNTGGVGTNTVFPLTTRSGGANIPVPELVVFGDSDSKFICRNQDLCTQSGFVYVSSSNIQVGKAAEVIRIQGTLCNEGFGTAPEWRLDKTVDNVRVEVALQYTTADEERVRCYANNAFNSAGGTHLSGFRAALTRALNTYGSKEGMFKNDLKPVAEDFREGLTAVVSVQVPEPQLEAQTKVRLNKGVVFTTTKVREERAYQVANRSQQDRLLVLEHPYRPEFAIVS